MCFISSNLFSQKNESSISGLPVNHSAGEFAVSLSPNLIFSNNTVKAAGGLKIQFFVSSRISFDADLVVSGNYLHLDPGLIGVPLGIIILADNEDGHTLNEFLLSLAGFALSVEHISYHVPVNTTTDISPYMCVLRYRRSKYNEMNTLDGDLTGYLKNNVCFAAGLQVNKLLGKFIIAPYVDYSISYTDGNSYFNCGLYCGYRFIK